MIASIDSALVERFAADVGRLAQRPTPATPLAVAVSGGADSMALLLLAAGAWRDAVIAATVDHGLRASAADECAMVARVCADLGVRHVTLGGTIRSGASVQAQARSLRYQLLVDWSERERVAALATAHQADDQAETFLMRATRGAGLSGLAGVRASRRIDGRGVLLVRPLLAWRRVALRAVAERAGVPFVDDPANDDPRHDRTRFRRMLHEHQWIDVPRLARSASHLADVDSDMRSIVDWLWGERQRAARQGEIGVDIAHLPRALKRRLAQRAISEIRQRAGIKQPDWIPQTNIEPLLDALERAKAATQAGVLVRPSGNVWHFEPAPPRRAR